MTGGKAARRGQRVWISAGKLREEQRHQRGVLAGGSKQMDSKTGRAQGMKLQQHLHDIGQLRPTDAVA